MFTTTAQPLWRASFFLLFIPQTCAHHRLPTFFVCAKRPKRESQKKILAGYIGDRFYRSTSTQSTFDLKICKERPPIARSIPRSSRQRGAASAAGGLQ